MGSVRDGCFSAPTAHTSGSRQIGDDANLALELDHSLELTVDLIESTAKECDLLALLERLDSQACEFPVIRAKSPLIPDEDQPYQSGDGRCDRRLLDSRFRNRNLNGARAGIPNPDERIRIHRLSIRPF